MTTCRKCGYHDEFRTSRFDFEREVLESKHYDTAGPDVRSLILELLAKTGAYHLEKTAGKKPKWGYPTLEGFGFAWTMTSTGGTLWRMPLELWKTRGWSPKNYFDSTNKTWTVRRNKKPESFEDQREREYQEAKL